MKKLNLIKTFSVIISSLLLLVLFQNCGGLDDSDRSSLSSLSNGLDSGVVNKKPIINCMLKADNEFRNVSTIPGNRTFSAEKFDVNSVISVDCSETSDESAVSELSLAIDKDYNPESPNFITVNSSFAMSTLSVGNHNMALKVSDPQGETSIRAFALVIECEDNAVSPTISNPNSAISVTEGSKVGLFNYSVSGVSGGNDLMYAWDFNGDDVYDPFDPGSGGDGSKEIFTSSQSLSDIYVNLSTRNSGGTSRQVKLRVRNGCFKETEFIVSKNLNTSHALSGSDQAVVLSYDYLQGDVSPTNGDLSDKRRKGDYLATDNNRGDYTEFRCQLNNRGNGNANLQIDTVKRYRDSEEASGGMSIKVVNIADDGGAGSQNFSGASAPDISKANFKVAAQSDGILQEIYSTTGSGCSVQMRMVRNIGAKPCSNGTSGRPSEVITYQGEFSCPNLNLEGGNKSVEIENGKFSCAQSVGASSCGGGGGGGTPPPTF